MNNISFLNDQMGILLSEHFEIDLLQELGCESNSFDAATLIPQRIFPSKRGVKFCYTISEKQNSYFLKADYYVGVDWLINGKRFIQVKPKLNTKVLQRFDNELDKEENALSGSETTFESDDLEDEGDLKQLNYLKLLMDAFQHPEIAQQTDNLILIDWTAAEIEIKQEDDALTPFLVVQFLNKLKHIVRKGLKKSYYKVQEDLNNRIKGKILIGANIKQNVLKNRLTKALCEYQEFGINSQENRFLKKVLYFCSNYVHQNAQLFAGNQKSLDQLITYCKCAFQSVGDEIKVISLKSIRHNSFFKEYKDAITIGQNILKRFAYNISKTVSCSKIKTPPFWIDMPKLFELYVYRHLLAVFKANEIRFQLPTHGNIIDFLINKPGNEMVIDAKYKIRYRSGHIHQDIRQVAGYARLNKVYEALNKSKKPIDIIDCVIIYPSIGDTSDQPDFTLEKGLVEPDPIKAYNRVYKIGIPMPYLKQN